ncbi:probable metal-nicotianamine transporter YSL8 [Dioscorea cayenensis subsp. rotundata]|uniref:Probable metal-nicotianamine transporter YSL8 n=1 Tax=Dioscorea cayennensis subsp. rotundata TaxID=55577 RepID=A0AB40CKQ1_DIOCR|nr:probable metal-nicotianamine transporter YSL8 [Dioscorea cayenensis subsp. rotundata]
MANGEGEREDGQHNNNLPDKGSVEQMFERMEVPKWTEQLTPRSFVVSLGPLAFVMLKFLTTIMDHMAILKVPFTRQENAVVHACLLACTSITLNGGFGTYYLAMNPYMGVNFNNPADSKQLDPKWLILFHFMTSFIGIFTVVPLSKVLLIRHKLKYPTGMTMANIINSFHAKNVTLMGRKQKMALLKAFIAAISWRELNWLFSASAMCGIASMPVLGFNALFLGFHFNFNTAAMAVGMLNELSVTIPMLLGAIFSWGWFWPYIVSKEGDWYKAGQPFISMTGQSGYVVSVTIAIALGDGIFHMGIVVIQVCYEFYIRHKQKHLILPFSLWSGPEIPSMSYDDRRRTNLFVQDRIPIQVALGGYVLFATISAIVIPVLFPSLHSFQIAAAYILAPLLSFSNAFCTGLTDWTLASAFTKFTIFFFGAWTSSDKPGSVIASLAASGIVTAVVNTASDLMTDFQTGYMTMTSPRSMFVAQIIGTAMGCIMAPICYMFFAPYSPGLLSGESLYPAGYASTYRVMAESSIKGFDFLPKNSVALATCFFFGTIAVNSLREVAKGMKWGIYRFIPSLMPMAISFYGGPSFSFDMVLGSIIACMWKRCSKSHAKLFVGVVASGFIAGDAFSQLLDSILYRFRLTAPYCMRFLTRADAASVAAFLAAVP